ncbi:galactose-1-phosphate uridylyltransferase [candidate division KSB1 bacterium]|nr:galactose-1-phosphate uridylyltransferase [candidate division KSB1 bacterium]
MAQEKRTPPELRKDPIIGRWVIISTDRGKRPLDWSVEPEKKAGGFCPFCPGNEDKTPPEIYSVRPDGSDPNTPGWKIRVVSNKFPALQIEGELLRRGEGIFDKMNGVGAHEVLIETPDHYLDMSELSDIHVRDIFWAIKTRINDLQKDIRFKYILAFKNHGSAAGASLAHSHIQMIATPIIPKRVQEEMEGAQKYYKYKERCIFCDIIRQELHTDIRIVKANKNFVSLEPFAARFPFETWVMPINHSSRFEDISYDDTLELAKLMKEILQKIKTTLGNPPFNFIIHTAPQQEESNYEYHWHIEIIPKLTKIAGFEWGSGFYINHVPPEDAARLLREGGGQ